MVNATLKLAPRFAAAVFLLLVTFPASASSCSVALDVATARSEFDRLGELRRSNPARVRDADYRAAAARYIGLAEQCYAEIFGAEANEPTAIDAGGVWFSADGSEPFVSFGTKWGAGSPFPGGANVPGPGIPATVTYSYMDNGVDLSAEETGISNTAITSLGSFEPCFLTEIETAMDAWSAVAQISFEQVADDGAPFDASGASGDIRIGAHVFDGTGGTLAHGYYPPPNGNTAAGDIHFDLDEVWSCEDTGPNFAFGIVALHELGHAAIGLAHESVEVAIMNPYYNPAVDLLQPDDVVGAEQIYGGAGTGAPSCSVVMSSAVYAGSEPVLLESMTLANENALTSAAVEWKVWFGPVGSAPLGIVNAGADGSVSLPPDFYLDLVEPGPQQLFLASDLELGHHELGCRLVDPTTGMTLAEDIADFLVEPRPGM